MSEVLIFTPPHNGLVAFNNNGRAGYGIYLGVSETKMRVFDPYREVVVSIDIKDTDDYSLQLTNFDYRSLTKLGRNWGRGVLVQYLNDRLEVDDIRNRYPPTNNDILVLTRDRREIVVTDPRLKFVGHINHDS